jgi:uncharacterized protein (DUF58 family)
MSELPDHHLLLSIKDLSLAARRTIEGFMAGINKSQVKGPGLEFSQYRSYQPGDDLRWLDWKRYARSDRYYIRESEIETSISIRFLIDASKSMDHRDELSGITITKMDYARLLAASLGWLAYMQGDSLGLYVFCDGEVYSLPSRKDPQHLARYFHQLEGVRPGGKMGDLQSYKHIFSGESRRELLVYISDLYEEEGEISRMLDVLASMRHEILVFHVMGRNELEKDFSGYSRVEDLETGEQISVTGGKESYAERMQGWLSGVRMRLLDKQIGYQLMRMDRPMDQAIRDFLKQRQQMKG